MCNRTDTLEINHTHNRAQLFFCFCFFISPSLSWSSCTPLGSVVVLFSPPPHPPRRNPLIRSEGFQKRLLLPFRPIPASYHETYYCCALFKTYIMYQMYCRVRAKIPQQVNTAVCQRVHIGKEMVASALIFGILSFRDREWTVFRFFAKSSHDKLPQNILF